MGKNRSLGAAVLLLILPGLAFSVQAPGNQGTGPLPKPIAQFYEDYSFVSSFSTPQERAILIKNPRTPALPGKPTSDRLDKVSLLMNKLGAQVTCLDPKMVIGPPRAIGRLSYEGIAEVQRAEVWGDRATVEIVISGLKPEANLQLIGEYEASVGDSTKTPFLGQRPLTARSSSFRRAEIHTWVKTNGEWKKNEVNVIPLK